MDPVIQIFFIAGSLILILLQITTPPSASSKHQGERKIPGMPIHSPVYPAPPNRFMGREYFIITYETDPAALEKVVPYPLKVVEPVVKYEFIRMPDSSGFGDYTESGQVIPVEFNGTSGLFVLSMYLDNEPAILAGREIWGFPKKYGHPSLRVDPVSRDTLVGRLYYGELEVARGTMGYKWQALPTDDLKKYLENTPNYLIKIIPDVDGSPKIHQLVRYHLGDVTVTGAWTGPTDLDLYRHALAPVADLPVKKIISGVHFISNLTLLAGTVDYDYLG